MAGDHKNLHQKLSLALLEHRKTTAAPLVETTIMDRLHLHQFLHRPV